MQSPQEAAGEFEARPRIPGGDDEQFAGYGVMGLPFATDHYLALRVFPAASIGPGYRAVWHRDPAGRWTVYATEPPERSCARYFGAALSATRQVPIDVTWGDPFTFDVTIPGTLDWRVRLGRTAATRFLTGAGSVLPEAGWRSTTVLSLMGPFAATVLGAGRIGLTGQVPNGQHYRAAPRRLWAVAESSARLAGEDLGHPGPLREQDRLGDFWMPQRGLFALGLSSYDVFDPTHHRPATPGRAESIPGGAR